MELRFINKLITPLSKGQWRYFLEKLLTNQVFNQHSNSLRATSNSTVKIELPMIYHSITTQRTVNIPYNVKRGIYRVISPQVYRQVNDNWEPTDKVTIDSEILQVYVANSPESVIVLEYDSPTIDSYFLDYSKQLPLGGYMPRPFEINSFKQSALLSFLRNGYLNKVKFSDTADVQSEYSIDIKRRGLIHIPASNNTIVIESWDFEFIPYVSSETLQGDFNSDYNNDFNNESSSVSSETLQGEFNSDYNNDFNNESSSVSSVAIGDFLLVTSLYAGENSHTRFVVLTAYKNIAYCRLFTGDTLPVHWAESTIVSCTVYRHWGSYDKTLVPNLVSLYLGSNIPQVADINKALPINGKAENIQYTLTVLTQMFEFAGYKTLEVPTVPNYGLLVIDGNDSYTIDNVVDWVTVQSFTGTPITSYTGPLRAYLFVNSNETGYTRTARITVYPEHGDPIEIYVTQKPVTMNVVLDSDSPVNVPVAQSKSLLTTVYVGSASVWAFEFESIYLNSHYESFVESLDFDPDAHFIVPYAIDSSGKVTWKIQGTSHFTYIFKCATFATDCANGVVYNPDLASNNVITFQRYMKYTLEGVASVSPVTKYIRLNKRLGFQSFFSYVALTPTGSASGATQLLFDESVSGTRVVEMSSSPFAYKCNGEFKFGHDSDASKYIKSNASKWKLQLIANDVAIWTSSDISGNQNNRSFVIPDNKTGVDRILKSRVLIGNYVLWEITGFTQLAQSVTQQLASAKSRKEMIGDTSLYNFILDLASLTIIGFNFPNECLYITEPWLTVTYYVYLVLHIDVGESTDNYVNYYKLLGTFTVTPDASNPKVFDLNQVLSQRIPPGNQADYKVFVELCTVQRHLNHNSSGLYDTWDGKQTSRQVVPSSAYRRWDTNVEGEDQDSHHGPHD